MREKAAQHPNIVTWLVLAVGMLAVLFWSAREVSLTGGQRFWLGVATVLLAGLCAWIISWEADEDEAWEDEAASAPQGEPRATQPETEPTAGQPEAEEAQTSPSPRGSAEDAGEPEGDDAASTDQT